MDFFNGYNDMTGYREHYILMKEHSFKKLRPMLRSMLQDKTVLDYGCGRSGSLGYFDENVSGLDNDEFNEAAIYHSWDDVKARKFDVVLFSHVLEHMPYEVSLKMVRRAFEHTDKVVIVVPNSYENIFIYQKNDLTHVCDPYNNADFCYMLEKDGAVVDRIIVCDIFNNMSIRAWLPRLLFALIMKTSPFHNYVIVLKSGGV